MLVADLTYGYLESFVKLGSGSKISNVLPMNGEFGLLKEATTALVSIAMESSIVT
jgi:hypothetical protein